MTHHIGVHRILVAYVHDRLTFHICRGSDLTESSIRGRWKSGRRVGDELRRGCIVNIIRDTLYFRQETEQTDPSLTKLDLDHSFLDYFHTQGQCQIADNQSCLQAESHSPDHLGLRRSISSRGVQKGSLNLNYHKRSYYICIAVVGRTKYEDVKK